MAKVTFIDPIATVKGRLGRRSKDKMDVQRQKIYGYTSDGKPITGPNESYLLHPHQGEWSEGAVKNRQLFAMAQHLAKQELSDPVLAAQWKKAFEAQFNTHKSGVKRYVKLQTYVVAQLHSRLKAEQ